MTSCKWQCLTVLCFKWRLLWTIWPGPAPSSDSRHERPGFNCASSGGGLSDFNDLSPWSWSLRTQKTVSFSLIQDSETDVFRQIISFLLAPLKNSCPKKIIFIFLCISKHTYFGTIKIFFLTFLKIFRHKKDCLRLRLAGLLIVSWQIPGPEFN